MHEQSTYSTHTVMFNLGFLVINAFLFTRYGQLLLVILLYYSKYLYEIMLLNFLILVDIQHSPDPEYKHSDSQWNAWNMHDTHYPQKYFFWFSWRSIHISKSLWKIPSSIIFLASYVRTWPWKRVKSIHVFIKLKCSIPCMRSYRHFLFLSSVFEFERVL